MTTEAYKNPGKELLHRYKLTQSFIQKQNISEGLKILDLGTRNPFTEIMEEMGFIVQNSGIVDLDMEPETVKKYDANVVTAFEILEHLVSPLQVLSNLPGEKLFATVPLQLWFARAYKHATDPWDRHFHEFEDWQFDWLLEKAGWKIIDKEKWNSPFTKIGIRPFLRSITPRYYAVYAERV